MDVTVGDSVIPKSPPKYPDSEWHRAARGRYHLQFVRRGRQGGAVAILTAFQAMQRDLGQAIEAHWYDCRAGTDRGVAGHPLVGPSTCAHAPRKHRMECDRNRSGQTNLAATGVAAEQHIKARIGGLAIDLRRVRQQNRKRTTWDLGCCLST